MTQSLQIPDTENSFAGSYLEKNCLVYEEKSSEVTKENMTLSLQSLDIKTNPCSYLTKQIAWCFKKCLL